MSSSAVEYQRIIVGYHGTDQALVDRVLKGEHLAPSENEWDWLGSGIYFWEFGPRRALEFAHEQKHRGKIQNPAVIGAYINLGRCFDLTDVAHTKQLSVAFHDWLAGFQGENPPENRSADGKEHDLLLRYRDCAVINWFMALLDSRVQHSYYQSVRGVFVEGAPVFTGSAIREKTHVQVSLRDPSCILGYFLPTTFFGEEG